MHVNLDEKKLNLVISDCFEYKDKIKEYGGTWDKVNHVWKAPLSSLLDICDITPQRRGSQEVVELYLAMQQQKGWLDLVKDNKVKVSDHAFLYEHQRKCVDIASRYPRFAFFLDTGTGKTLTSLEIINQDLGRKWLILTPKAIIKTAWVGDKNQWFPGMRLLPLSKNMKKIDYEKLCVEWGIAYTRRHSVDELKEMLMEQAQVFIVNPESFKLQDKELLKLGVTGLIVDESTTIKNPVSQISKCVTAFGNKMHRLYILSGKPAPNSLLDYFAQMRLVNPGVFGNSYQRFKLRYFFETGYGGYTLAPKPTAEQEVAERIKPHSIVIRKEDCLDLPDKTYIHRLIELDSKTMKAYKDFQEQMIMELSTDDTVSAPNAASKIMKLRQLTSGFIYDSEGLARDFHNAKLNELKNTLEELGEHQSIVWLQFKEEFAKIGKMLDSMGIPWTTAYSGSKNIDNNIEDFKTGRAQVILAHPGSVKFGVTFTNCTYSIYYSLSYNYEDYYQSHDRIYRLGQTKKCTYIFLLCEKTVDEVILKALEHKKKLAEIVEDMIREGRLDGK